jgi:hypothetical protein
LEGEVREPLWGLFLELLRVRRDYGHENRPKNPDIELNNILWSLSKKLWVRCWHDSRVRLISPGSS